MDIKTLQSWVREWHLETFGNDLEIVRVIRKFDEESVEFFNAAMERAENCGKQNSPEEAADVLLVLLAYCAREGIDLEAEALKKFEINKKRKWEEKGGRFVRVRG